MFFWVFFEINLNGKCFQNYSRWKDKPSKCQPQKMVKHTQAIRRLLTTNCLSAFDHLWGWRSKIKDEKLHTNLLTTAHLQMQGKPISFVKMIYKNCAKKMHMNKKMVGNSCMSYMRQSIQEWTKWNLPLKSLMWYGLVEQVSHLLLICQLLILNMYLSAG